jgi:hypothetical protein
LEITVNKHRKGTERLSGRKILEEMSHLNSTWLWYAGKSKPENALDDPTQIQAEVLKALGWKIHDGGVLQKVNA